MSTKTRSRPKIVPTPDPPPPAVGGGDRTRVRIICLLLGAVTLACYWPVLGCDFAGYDDTVYVTDNWHVQRGLSWAGMDWAFSDLSAGFWHPLTWLSLMLDATLYGPHAGGFHLTNLLLHLCSTLLVFFILWRTTGAPWRSAMVAALFSLHPLHVEPVAWIGERKEVLSAFFGLLTLRAYVQYASPMPVASAKSGPFSKIRPVHFYWLALLFFACGLMSKTMVVTLPVVMLLLDYWPLKRISNGEFRVSSHSSPGTRPSSLVSLVIEKVPFFLLALLTGLLTIHAEKDVGAAPSFARLPVYLRGENALVSSWRYLSQTFWPVNLAVFYPYPKSFPVAEVMMGAAILLVVTVAAIALASRRSYLAVGWFWFVITLLPVSGLIQVGSHSRADRYTYVPLIGLFIVLVWGGAEILGRLRGARIWAMIIAVPVLLGCGLRSQDQVRYWRNPEVLFRHALAVTQDSYLAYNNVGYYLMNNYGRYDEAIDDFKHAIQLNPEEASAYDNLGFALEATGKTAEAVKVYEAGLQLKQKQPNTHNDYGNALSNEGRLDDAIAQYELALQEKPGYSDAHNNLGIALVQKGRLGEAMDQFHLAIQDNPYSATAHNSLGNVLVMQQRFQDALPEYQAALQLQPDYDQAQNNFGYALSALGRDDEAVPHYREALRLNAGYVNAHYNLGCALARLGQRDQAIAEIQAALRLQPDYPDARKKLAELGVTASPVISHEQAGQKN